jgi:hypothetical protein
MSKRYTVIVLQTEDAIYDIVTNSIVCKSETKANKVLASSIESIRNMYGLSKDDVLDVTDDMEPNVLKKYEIDIDQFLEEESEKKLSGEELTAKCFNRKTGRSIDAYTLFILESEYLDDSKEHVNHKCGVSMFSSISFGDTYPIKFELNDVNINIIFSLEDIKNKTGLDLNDISTIEDRKLNMNITITGKSGSVIFGNIKKSIIIYADGRPDYNYIDIIKTELHDIDNGTVVSEDDFDDFIDRLIIVLKQFFKEYYEKYNR